MIIAGYPIYWVFTNEAARLAQAVAANETLRVGYQLSDRSLWMVLNTTPTWERVDHQHPRMLGIDGGSFTETYNVENSYNLVDGGKFTDSYAGKEPVDGGSLATPYADNVYRFDGGYLNG